MILIHYLNKKPKSNILFLLTFYSVYFLQFEFVIFPFGEGQGGRRERELNMLGAKFSVSRRRYFFLTFFKGIINLLNFSIFQGQGIFKRKDFRMKAQDVCTNVHIYRIQLL